ncbi:unnamed protein product [Mytilus coruscus]|uniref:Apple domain-containing protein n=1 Tax=Mytilus coruscus TaxID=42192 RepID=A0A6J8CD14_MYTCO|nr:unnamed protein product [Mytilus coruscus]
MELWILMLTASLFNTLVGVIDATTTETVYAGDGWDENSTVFYINESVTWYSAKQAHNRDCLFGKTVVNRRNLIMNVAIYLDSAYSLNDTLIWLGAIKSEHTGLLYYSDTCEPVKDYIVNKINLPAVLGNTECLLYDISLRVFSYGNCLDKHPYICISREGDIDTTTLTRANVSSVNANSPYVKKYIKPHASLEICIENCEVDSMHCLGALFNRTESNCYHYMDKNFGDMEAKHEFVLIKAEDRTQFYWKSWQRVYFAFTRFGGPVTDQNENVFDCTHMNLNTCTCTCTTTKLSTVNMNNIEDSIAEIKKNLSIAKEDLSATKRKLTCTEDPRPTSKAIGSFGIVILATVVSVLVLTDIHTIYVFLIKKRKE